MNIDWVMGRVAYRDTGIIGIDWVMGSIYSVGNWMDRHHLILSLYTEYTHSIFTNFLCHSLLVRFLIPTQFHGFSWLGSITSSHSLPILLEPEPLFLTNTLQMPCEVQQSIHYPLSSFLHCHFTTPHTRMAAASTQSTARSVTCTPRYTWKPLHWSSKHLDLTILAFWFDIIHILSEAPRKRNGFCWCGAKDQMIILTQ